MNLNRLLVISFFVLVISTLQTDSGIIFSLLMKVLLLKGALFMSMPLSIGAFMMGQGMGFFAGNMMGGYMMLTAANRYHNSEKSKWMSTPSYYPSNQGGAGWGWGKQTKYSNAYDKGKHIGAALASIKNQKVKIASAVHHVKGFLGGLKKPKITPGWGSGGYKYKGRPIYHRPTPSKGWGWGSESSLSTFTNSHGASPEEHDYSTYKELSSNPVKHGGYKTNFNSHGGSGNIYKGELDYSNFYPASPGSQYEAEGSSYTTKDPANTFYTSVYEGPGHEYTGMLTHNHQDSSYFPPAEDKSSEDIYPSNAKENLADSSTVAPNPIIEKYLEKRLEEEASKQQDVEQKQEAQQLIQILRKAYLKQLVESLKEEETVSKVSSEFSSRESRSIESRESGEKKRNDNNIMKILMEQMRRMDMDVNQSEIEHVISTPETKEEYVTSSEIPTSTSTVIPSTTSSENPAKLHTDIFLTSTEKALIELASNTERNTNQITSTETVIQQTTEKEESRPSSTTLKPLEELSITDIPAMWVKVDNTFNNNEAEPFIIRVKRGTTVMEEGAEDEISVEDEQSQKNVHESQQQQRVATNPSPEVQNQIQSFVEDIKKFFTLLNVLDQDQCLQKLVCDVHTNQKDPNTLSQYEQNILTTFRLMKALMPVGDEDSTTKYRRSALIGETGQSLELCQQSYATCGYSSSQIITLGTQGEATPGDWTGAESTVSGASSRSDYVTLMPRVRRTLRSFYL